MTTKCPTCGEDEAYTGNCWTSERDTRALCKQAKPAPAEVAQGEAVEVIGAVILGGIFPGGSGPELGDIDIELNPDVLDRIQQETVNSADDVMLSLMTVAQHNRIVEALTAPPSPDWREHSRHIAKGERCPETIETLQAAWARDQELMLDQKAEISRLKEKLNQARQRRPSPDAELIRQCIAEELESWTGDYRKTAQHALCCLQARIDAKLAELGK